jgi:hypothetical protein
MGARQGQSGDENETEDNEIADNKRQQQANVKKRMSLKQIRG